MPLSRCKVFSRDNLRCFLTESHPRQLHSFGTRAPGPPSPPPAPHLGERYESEPEGDQWVEALVAWVTHVLSIARDRRVLSPDMIEDGEAIITGLTSDRARQSGGDAAEVARLRAALEDELTDAIAEIERLCGAMSREKFNWYVDGSRRVQRLRAALAPPAAEEP